MKEKRLRYILEERLDPTPLPDGIFRFKRLDTSKTKRTFLLTKASIPFVPLEHAANKDYVPKLMYVTAVMKPSVDPEGRPKCTFIVGWEKSSVSNTGVWSQKCTLS